MAKTFLFLMLIGITATPVFAADTIKIAITGPFTGSSASIGGSMRKGAKLAIAEINAHAGIVINGQKMRFEVIERDDEAKDGRGVLIAQELASRKDLSGIIGSENTGVVLAGDKIFQDKGITKIITPAAASACMTQWGKVSAQDLSIFHFAAHDGIQAEMVVEAAINRNFKKVALIHDTTGYGLSGRDALLEQIKKQGDKLEVVALEKFNTSDKDMSAQLLKARSAGAQAILLWGMGPGQAAIANTMARMNIQFPLIGSWTLSLSSFIDYAGKNGNGALMPQTFIEEPITPKAKAFITCYHKAYGVHRIASPVAAAQGYDAIYIFAAAVQQAQSVNSQKIKEALENLHQPVEGVITTWKKPFTRWDPTNVGTHEAFRRENAIMGMVQDGHVVFSNDADRQRLIRNACK